jgi:hypothetical protein
MVLIDGQEAKHITFEKKILCIFASHLITMNISFTKEEGYYAYS